VGSSGLKYLTRRARLDCAEGRLPAIVDTMLKGVSMITSDLIARLMHTIEQLLEGANTIRRLPEMSHGA
jgi:hypothetical protein